MISTKTLLNIFFIIILIAMLIVTSWASLYENVIDGGAKLIAEPWGVATLFDTYFAFFVFFVWLAYKENNFIKNLIWFVLIVFLGNIAMAVYALMQINKIKGPFTAEKLLLRN